MAIKPSGVPYDRLGVDDIVVLSISAGEVVEGSARPSSDTPTHLHLYRQFPAMGGRGPHAFDLRDLFRPGLAGNSLPGDDARGQFLRADPRHPAHDRCGNKSGLRIKHRPGDRRTFKKRARSGAIPGVLVASHAPFAWGATVEKAVENAIVLEFSAQMALNSLALSPKVSPISQTLLDKHFLRKHGPKAYYGQT